MRYQFQLAGEPAARARDTINEAALDALDAGFATPDNFGRIVLADEAEIVDLQKQKTN